MKGIQELPTLYLQLKKKKNCFQIKSLKRSIREHMDSICFQNFYAEALISNVMVFGDEAFEG